MSELILEAGKYYEDREGNVTEPLKKMNRELFPYESTVTGKRRTWMGNGRYHIGNNESVLDLVKVVEEEPSDSGLLKRVNKTTQPEAPIHTYIDTNGDEKSVDVVHKDQLVSVQEELPAMQSYEKTIEETVRQWEPKEIELIAGEWYKVTETKSPALYAGKTEGHDTWVAKSGSPIVYMNLTAIKHLPECWSHDYKVKSVQEEVLDDLGIKVELMTSEEYRKFSIETTDTRKGDYLIVSNVFNSNELRAIADYIEHLEQQGEK